MTRLAVCIAAICIATPAVAVADDWSHTAEFTNARSTSLRIVEPEGYTVTVAGRTDSVPAVFQLDNVNDYVTLQIKAPDGASWSKKIEVKEYRQTVVRVKHDKAAAKPDAPKGKAMAFVGTVKNASNKCKAELHTTIKLDFMLGPDLVKSAEVKSGGRTNLELPEGTYNVRRYQQDGEEWVFDNTDKFGVSKDGWVYEWGCVPRRRRR